MYWVVQCVLEPYNNVASAAVDPGPDDLAAASPDRLLARMDLAQCGFELRREGLTNLAILYELLLNCANDLGE